MSTAQSDLTEAIAAVCPIDGICVQRNRIDFRPEATPAQRAAAQAVWDGWDFSEAAQQARDEAKQPERTALQQAAAAAITANQAYLATPTPTAAQVRDQTAALTQQINRVIRRLIQLD